MLSLWTRMMVEVLFTATACAGLARSHDASRAEHLRDTALLVLLRPILHRSAAASHHASFLRVVHSVVLHHRRRPLYGANLNAEQSLGESNILIQYVNRGSDPEVIGITPNYPAKARKLLCSRPHS